SAAYTDKSTIAVGAIGSWLWTFDDGTTSTLQNPKHKWLTTGTHTTTLAVKSAGGCIATNTATHTISVDPLPTADFTFTVDCTTKTVTFTDASTPAGSVKEWHWDFGDGSAPVVKTSGAAFTH